MSDIAIRAADLRKVYRLYSKPAYRFLDLFGLLGDRQGAYTEHAALNGVDLEIRRGEKVAVIGRNGAGKSTFLKLVTRVTEPTAGTLDVRGDVHALLQIGTGFHPDFTGRENVRAYLAQLGVTGSDADARCADAIAFAELEEYIDQPVKTYSTGMAMRLMFSASTAITPDLLVLDEVLGVGDAYFAQKSYERMRDLCDRNGSTLLLVTHDIYSATKMCSRVIWFDRGVVAMDGDATDVVKAYEESIRAQEERRLRLKTQALLDRSRDATVDDADVRLIVEIAGEGGRPQRAPVYIASMVLTAGDMRADLPIGVDAFDTRREAHLVAEGSNWGEAVEWHGRGARPLLNYGAPFHKVAGAVRLRRADLARGATLSVTCFSDEPCRLEVRTYVGDERHDLGVFETMAGAGWTTHNFAYDAGAGRHASRLPATAAGVQGAGDVVITDFRMVTAADALAHTVRHGEPVRFVTSYRISRPGLRERAQVFVVISRNNTERVCKFKADHLLFDYATSAEGSVEMRLNMPLGKGTYSVAVEIACEGYAEKGSRRFFSVDPDVYYCLTHALEFTVTDSGWIGDGTIFEGDAEWSMMPASSATRV